MPNGYKAHKRKHHREQTMMSPIPSPPDTVAAARPISQAARPNNETIFIPVQLPEQNHAEADNGTSDKPNWNATPNSSGWNISEPTSDQRPSPDINISAPAE